MFKRLVILGFLMLMQYVYDCTMGRIVSMPTAYFTMAISDALILLCLPMFGYNRLVRDLQDINYLAIMAHCYGFLIYMLYFPPVTYNCVIIILAIAQYTRLFWIGKDDDADYIGLPYCGHRGWIFYSPIINLQRIIHQKTNP